MSTERDDPLITLASGQTLRMREIRLYDQETVKQIALLKAQISKSLGGVSTGIGFLGSPAWVVGGAVALGLIEGLLSNTMKKQGTDMIKDVQTLSEWLKTNGRFFPAVQVMHVDRPHPQTWYAESIELKIVPKPQSNPRQGGLTKTLNVEAFANETIQSYKMRFVHDGNEFVRVNSDMGFVDVRWSYVVAYRPPQIG